MRYNLYRCAQINGSAATGYSSAQAMNALQEVFAQTMPQEMGYDYLGMSFQEQKAQQGVPPAAIFGESAAPPRRTKLEPRRPTRMMKSLLAAKNWNMPRA